MHYRIMAHGAAESHREQFARHETEYAPQIAGLIREGQSIAADDLQPALAHQRRFAADMATLFAAGEAAGQIFIMPATVTPAPGKFSDHRRPAFQLPLDLRRPPGRHNSLRPIRRRLANRPAIGRTARRRRTTPQ